MAIFDCWFWPTISFNGSLFVMSSVNRIDFDFQDHLEGNNILRGDCVEDLSLTIYTHRCIDPV